jgi:hypothetical protein
MKTVDTFTAIIYLGLKEGNGYYVGAVEDVESVCQQYCDEVGLCVSVTPTKFIYTNGREHGVSVGLINYPRFPATKEEILTKALDLAKTLKLEFQQWRVSIVTPDKTYMLGDE